MEEDDPGSIDAHRPQRNVHDVLADAHTTQAAAVQVERLLGDESLGEAALEHAGMVLLGQDYFALVRLLMRGWCGSSR